jgi:hypothetical protein
MAQTLPEVELAEVDGQPLVPEGGILTPEEGRRQYDEAVRHYMGISGEEFLRRWDAGEWHELYDDSEHPHTAILVALRPFAEQDS